MTRNDKAKRGKDRRPKRLKSGHCPSTAAATLAAPGSLARQKALLLAALRVWELKQRLQR